MARFLNLLIIILFTLAIFTVNAKPTKRRRGEPYGKIPETDEDRAHKNDKRERFRGKQHKRL